MIQEKWFGIGEVVATLKREYDKLTKSMVRFWEKEGLISPERTEGGHRKYSQQDVLRMRIIAELRQNRYLPISVVKGIIKRLDQDPSYDLDLADETFGQQVPEVQQVTLAQAAQISGLTLPQMAQIETAGFLPGSDLQPGERLFDQADLEILGFIKQMAAVGFAIEDLQFYVKDTKKHIQHEAALWEKMAETMEDGPAEAETRQELVYRANKFRHLIYQKYGGLVDSTAHAAFLSADKQDR